MVFETRVELLFVGRQGVPGLLQRPRPEASGRGRLFLKLLSAHAHSVCAHTRALCGCAVESLDSGVLRQRGRREGAAEMRAPDAAACARRHKQSALESCHLACTALAPGPPAARIPAGMQETQERADCRERVGT